MNDPAAQPQRFSIQVRQQPGAGRTYSAGKDRQPIDPPPIMQLRLAGFNPTSPHDIHDMQDQSFIVSCSLRSASPPYDDVSVLKWQDQTTGATRDERQINGNSSASPFYCEEDPDPNTDPGTAVPHLSHGLHRPPPATFFCFSDLSVHRAGSYRLEFQLVRISMDQPQCPVLHSVLSNPFNVVNASPSNHMQPKTPLVRGLIDRGAWFPWHE